MPSIAPIIPEIFLYAHQFLDKNLGALNTCVLIFSSLTMAWGVRCAQTIPAPRADPLPADYAAVRSAVSWASSTSSTRHKWEDGLLWARELKPTEQAAEALPPADLADPAQAQAELKNMPRNVGVFFSIYFLMTGLHAIHVLAGMGAITWILAPGAARPLRQPPLQAGRLRRPAIGTWSI